MYKAKGKIYTNGTPDPWDFIRMTKTDPIKNFPEYQKKQAKLIKSIKSKLAKLDDYKKYELDIQLMEVYLFTGWFLSQDCLDDLLKKNLFTAWRQKKSKRTVPMRRNRVRNAKANPFLLAYKLLFPTNDKNEQKKRSKWCICMAYAYEHNVPHTWLPGFIMQSGGYEKIRKKYKEGNFEPLVPFRAKYPLRKIKKAKQKRKNR